MADTDANWHEIETYRSMMDFGRGMLRFTFLANGGSIIAVLTFVGNLYSKGGNVPSMKCPLVLFIIGVFSSGLAGVSTYFIQFTIINENDEEAAKKNHISHRGWLGITVGLVLVSLLVFTIGAFVAVNRLQ